MTDEEFSFSSLERSRARLVDDITRNMPDTHKEFLLSFYNRTPRWELLGLKGVEQLPAVRWREVNLDKAGKETRNSLVVQLDEVFSR